MPWRPNRLTISLRLLLLVITGILSIATTIAHHQGLSEQLVATIKKRYGEQAEIRLEAWQNIIHDNLDLPEQQKLEAVNTFFNRAQFIDDIKLWKKTDYWATPVEFLARNAGDCEDFAIAKYFTLKDMGVDTKKLRITYVKALRLNQAHMVLAYYPTPASIPLILDNLTQQIKPASERTDLQPVYSFNADELWLSRTRNEQVRAGKPSQLGKWRELNQRLNKEEQFNNPGGTVLQKILPVDSTVAVTEKSAQESLATAMQNSNFSKRFEQHFYPGISLQKKLIHQPFPICGNRHDWLNNFLRPAKSQRIKPPCKKASITRLP